MGRGNGKSTPKHLVASIIHENVQRRSRAEQLRFKDLCTLKLSGVSGTNFGEHNIFTVGHHHFRPIEGGVIPESGEKNVLCRRLD